VKDATAQILRGLSTRPALDLTAPAAFAGASCGLLALLGATAETRLVALALANAALITRGASAVVRLLLAPDRPRLRLWRLEDATARHAHSLAVRFAAVAACGLLELQAAPLLRLEPAAYDASLRGWAWSRWSCCSARCAVTGRRWRTSSAARRPSRGGRGPLHPTVRLRDLGGTVHTIPFRATDTVSNRTKDYAFHVLDIGVA
jgi:hypothetical protein